LIRHSEIPCRDAMLASPNGYYPETRASHLYMHPQRREHRVFTSIPRDASIASLHAYPETRASRLYMHTQRREHRVFTCMPRDSSIASLHAYPETRASRLYMHPQRREHRVFIRYHPKRREHRVFTRIETRASRLYTDRDASIASLQLLRNFTQ
jgi:hypothetical protein